MTFDLRQSITVKVLGIGFLALLMLIPLAQVRELVSERNNLREQALATIAQGWGDAQNVGGPLLAIPKRTRALVNNVWTTTQESVEIVLADRLEMHATLAPEMRGYGIYSTPVYLAELKIFGSFIGRDICAFGTQAHDATQTNCLLDQAELRLPISDVRGIRRISALRIDDQEYTFEPYSGTAMRAVGLPIDLSRWSADRHTFSLDLTLAGTASLRFLPLARSTQVDVAAPWPDPSFSGAFLPAQRHVDAHGFDAQWQVLDLNRSFGQHWLDDATHAMDLRRDAFGVNLYLQADVYQQNERAGKYGVLFVALTFVAFFLFEVLKKLRVHPVQYLLVGLALSTFYVVLLALSEQIGFALAYLAAASAVVILVGGYAVAVLRACRAGGLLAATLALVYALLYGLVVSEQYSLLMGAIALFAVVAALMYLTRKVDWYTYASVSAIR